MAGSCVCIYEQFRLDETAYPHVFPPGDQHPPIGFNPINISNLRGVSPAPVFSEQAADGDFRAANEEGGRFQMQNYRTDFLRRFVQQQLRQASPQELQGQMDRAEAVIAELGVNDQYSVGDLCQRIGCEAPTNMPDSKVAGADAVHDLRLLIEELSNRAAISVETVDEPVLTAREISRQFDVSLKTVDRWRARGLVGRRFLFGNRKRIGFLKSSVDRFVARHPELVERGQQFRRLTDTERGEIIQQALQLAGSGAARSKVVGRLAEQFQRSRDVIRQTLKSHDNEHPQRPIFRTASAPLTEPMKDEILRSYGRGVSAEQLAKKYHRSKATIHRVIREGRVQQVFAVPIEFVGNESFDDPHAEQEILGPEPEAPQRKGLMRAPAGLPPYLASLYDQPLLSREQETYYFRKMNYLKFRAARLRDRLDPKRATLRDVDRVESLLQQAGEIKNLLVRRNLRLVVSIAKKYAPTGGNLFELISDGNISLMRAIDRFDYSRGFKLSTYATWAIKNNFARSVPSEYVHLDRFRTGHDELFQHSRDDRSSQFEEEWTNRQQNEALNGLLQRLHGRDRDILVSHYGLARAEPETLAQIGDRLGVSKERIRQLEARALKKLHEIAAEEKLDIAGMN